MAAPDPKRLLLTGPVHGLARWRGALARLDWLEVVERALLEVVPRTLPAIAQRLDWLCVTSANALEALASHRDELAGVPAAVVGERSAEGLAAWGIDVAVGPAASADDLLRLWSDRLEPGQRVLWPRGSVSDEFAGSLRGRGLEVDDPIAYETRERSGDGGLPSADFLFLASPSAVRAATRLDRAGAAPLALAIGETTARALRDWMAREPSAVAGIEVLAKPEPECLVRLLCDLAGREA
ncbi:uroporphyrinogen-III synthase [Engelhardtia mirabilis]|uniref:Uroporphyrinogen-III synthase n=1 Tax=Engelhardtia mirabilis TaxID=2528011 RepID=A0A518BSW6_9BACT|nr:uroporphyrinogen-III synthase [Planctomycetes bacterium Pla133]QDV04384.1 uroporphyrinogen-III synthase [Planctomycetes bacterium Pla86]